MTKNEYMTNIDKWLTDNVSEFDRYNSFRSDAMICLDYIIVIEPFSMI